MKANLAIGIDLGGTNIKGVLLQADGQILQQMSLPTQDGEHRLDQQWLTRVQEAVATLTEKAGSPVPIGIAAPGLPAENRQSIAYMPGRLAGLEGLNWTNVLSTPSVKVLNDAKAALLAEHAFGAGQGKQHLAMLTLGTGVGGAVIIDGQLYTGLFNRAGHLGHLTLQTEAETGIVNLPGTLEEAIGNTSVAKRSHGRYTSTRQLVAAYQQGETWATSVWLESVKKLAIGLCSILNILAPEIVILGGGIIQAKAALFAPLTAFMDIYEWRPGGTQTPIVPAVFNNFAGAVGAAVYAFRASA